MHGKKIAIYASKMYYTSVKIGQQCFSIISAQDKPHIMSNFKNFLLAYVRLPIHSGVTLTTNYKSGMEDTTI